jgi:DNA polymerase III alpha subunit
MNIDAFGRRFLSSNDLADALYQNPSLNLRAFLVVDPEKYNTSIEETHSQFPKLQKYIEQSVSIEEFDNINQQHWNMPEEYQNFDIAEWVLGQCKTQEELQRVGQELLLYQERDLFNLLKYLKYFVDTMRENKILWGVGRGSSVSSYVLYLIGVHRINSIYYDLDITEFLR